MGETALNIFTAILIGAISSLITANLAFRKYRTERWWERKAETYTQLIESLHNLKAFFEANYEATMNMTEVPKEIDTDLDKKFKAAHQEISKLIDTGAFLLSEEACSRLKKYREESKAASESINWMEYLDSDGAATSECLEDMIRLAKIDLKT